MPGVFWYCGQCGAQNHETDGECQFCECQGAECARETCSGSRHHVEPDPFCRRCGRSGPVEEIPLHGFTELLCEPCARSEAPEMFSDRNSSCG